MIAKLQKTSFEENTAILSPYDKQMKTPVMIQRKISANREEKPTALTLARRSQSSVVGKALTGQARDFKEGVSAALPGTPLQSKFSSKRNLPRSQVRGSQNLGAVLQSGKMGTPARESRGFEEAAGSKVASLFPGPLNDTLAAQLGGTKPVGHSRGN